MLCRIGYDAGMEANKLVTIDPDILGGTAVFKGTRVPIRTLFDYIRDNYTLEQFLECFPTVTAEMARRVLAIAELALVSPIA